MVGYERSYNGRAAGMRLEATLPGRSTLEVCLSFGPAGPLSFDELTGLAEAWSRSTAHAPHRR